MSDLFTPRRPDGRAEWRVVHDLVAPLPYGTLVSFEALYEALGSGDRHRVHRAVRRCNQQFMAEGTPRVLGNVRAVGYRVLRPVDYAPAALGYQQAARRKLSTAVDLARTAPLHELTPAQRDWAHKVVMVLTDNELRLRSQEQWQQDAERRLRELERRAGVEPELVVEVGAVEPAS